MTSMNFGSHVEMQSSDLIRICERASAGSTQLRERRIKSLEDHYQPLIDEYTKKPWYQKIFLLHPDELSFSGQYGARAEMKIGVNRANSDHERRLRDFKRLILAASFAESVLVSVEDLGCVMEWSDLLND